MESILSNVNVPILQTERLRLRGHRLKDFPKSAAMWADPNVVRHIGNRPLTEEEAWTRFLRYFGHWAVLHFGYWLIEEKETGTFVGEAGFADYRREIERMPGNVPEIGWALATHAHGKGYATEAIRVLTAWADRHFQTKTLCIINPENKASVRVAIKGGYREVLTTTYHGEPILVFLREPEAA
jgi:RimJ/RimL family protein N-acetyltransferase